MTIIEPKSYAVISCDAPNEDYPYWQINKQYKSGDMVIYENRLYKAAGDFTSENTPLIEINNFVDFGAVNSMAFADNMVSSQSKKETATIHDYMDIEIDLKEYVDTFAFINLNAYKVDFVGYDFRNVKSWYDYFFKPFTHSTTKRDVENWYEYFFKEISVKNEYIFTLPKKIMGKITIRIFGINGFAGLGMLVAGTSFYIGETLRGAQVGAVSYTKKITDEWGNTYIRPGRTAKKNNYEVVIDTIRIDNITAALNKALERGLCVFVGDSRDDGYDALTITGILTEFDLVISTLDKSELTIGIEGVI